MGKTDESREALIRGAAKLLRDRPGGRITVEELAAEADCARGLIHYHFKTKGALLGAAAERIWRDRAAAWTEALGASSPADAIDAAWRVLEREARNGTLRAAVLLTSHPDPLVGQSAKDGARSFRELVSESAVRILKGLGRKPTVRPAELSHLIVGVIVGLGWELAEGAGPEAAEGAWAAFWAGLLSLTT